MELKKLDKKVMALWFVESLIAVVLILAVAAIVIAFQMKAYNP